MTAAIAEAHAKTPLAGVVLKGNRFGLGAGANIGELMSAERAELGRFIDVGHEALYAIEEGPLPWVALVDGFALGGIYELALACRAIVATEKSTVGFPEIRLNIFPGLGGTQRMPRRERPRERRPIRSAVTRASPPSSRQELPRQGGARDQHDRCGHPSRRRRRQAFAAHFLRETVPSLARPPPDLANAEGLQGDGAADGPEGDHGPAEPARAVSWRST